MANSWIKKDRKITVFKVRVITRDIITDTVARFKSILGGRILSYERAIQDALEEAYAELLSEYPTIENIRFGTTEMISDGAELILYGEVSEREYEIAQKRKEEQVQKQKR